jgi:hypothetical protein
VCLSLWGSGWCFFVVVVVLGGDVQRFLVSFSSSSSFPCGFCTCTSSPFPHTVGFAILWESFSCPRVFAALLLALFFLVGVCA